MLPGVNYICAPATITREHRGSLPLPLPGRGGTCTLTRSIRVDPGASGEVVWEGRRPEMPAGHASASFGGGAPPSGPRPAVALLGLVGADARPVISRITAWCTRRSIAPPSSSGP